MDRTVKFIKNHSPYMAGDIAGFDESRADWLERAGIVKKVKAGGKNATNNNKKSKGISSKNISGSNK